MLAKYLNKAVMEVKTKQARSLANILLEDLLELLPHNGFHVRAARLVVSP